MENRSALGAIRRRWWIVVLLALVGVVGGALPAPAEVEETSALTRYSATHTLLQNTSDSSAVGGTGVAPSQVVLLATVGEVPRRVAESIGFAGAPPELAAQVLVEFDFQTGALTFTTTQDDPARAALVADAFAEETNAYLIERQDVVYQDRLAASLDRLQSLEQQITDLTAELAFSPDDPILIAQRDAVSRQYSVAFEQNELLTEAPALLSFTTIERAEALPVEQGGGGLSAPRSRLTRGALGGAAGAGIGVGLAVLLAAVDRRIRTREQAEHVLGMRSRVMIPRIKDQRRTGLVVRNGRHDALSDAYRTLRNVVGFVQSGLEPVDRARVTVVVSPGPGEGKTSLAANLAAAFVESGLRTIIVNTDFRRPRIASTVTKGPRQQAPYTLDEIETIDPQWLLQETIDPNLSLLDLSSLGSAGELARASARLIPQLAALCDAIVVDTSPVGATAEVLDVVPLADVVVVVSRIGQTNVDVAERSMAVLRDVTTAPMVLALTGVRTERATYYEYSDARRAEPRRPRFGRRRVYNGPERRSNNSGASTGPGGVDRRRPDPGAPVRRPASAAPPASERRHEVESVE